MPPVSLAGFRAGVIHSRLSCSLVWRDDLLTFFSPLSSSKLKKHPGRGRCDLHALQLHAGFSLVHAVSSLVSLVLPGWSCRDATVKLSHLVHEHVCSVPLEREKGHKPCFVRAQAALKWLMGTH